MKRVTYLLIILCLVVFLVDNCYAYDQNYSYNYELRNVTFDGTNGAIEGWDF